MGWLEMGPRIGTWGARIKQGDPSKTSEGFPVAQWLRPPASSAGAQIQLPVGELRSHTLLPKIKNKNGTTLGRSQDGSQAAGPRRDVSLSVQRLILTQRDSLPGLASLPPALQRHSWKRLSRTGRGEEFGSGPLAWGK